MKKVIVSGLVAIAIMSTYLALNSYLYQGEPVGSDVSIERYEATIVGQFACLPPKDLDVPRNDLCTFGILAVDGSHYAIDFAPLTEGIPPLEVGDSTTASGVVTPMEIAETDMWDTYNVVGILSVTSFE